MRILSDHFVTFLIFYFGGGNHINLDSPGGKLADPDSPADSALPHNPNLSGNPLEPRPSTLDLSISPPRPPPIYNVVVSRGLPLPQQRSLCVPQCLCAIPPAGCSGFPVPELRGRRRRAAERFPAHVEQPCWCEDCALLVWLISRIFKSVYGHLRWMLTLVFYRAPVMKVRFTTRSIPRLDRRILPLIHPFTIVARRNCVEHACLGS